MVGAATMVGTLLVHLKSSIQVCALVVPEPLNLIFTEKSPDILRLFTIKVRSVSSSLHSSPEPTKMSLIYTSTILEGFVPVYARLYFSEKDDIPPSILSAFI